MKYIYKYRDINKYTLKTLSNNELYFALPKQFNDPFDCKVNYFVDGTKEEIIQYFSKYPYSKEKL